MNLQYKFIESKGAPISLNGQNVIQLDTIPIHKGIVSIRFISILNGEFGVVLKSKNGYIVLSEGRHTKCLFTWNEPKLPRIINYEVNCTDGKLRVWNVYKVHHHTGEVTEDAWTGNAGMIVENRNRYARLYKCSSGLGEFNPEEFLFEIEWREFI